MSSPDRAVGYTRLSQVSDTSIRTQKENIRTYARENEMDLVDIYDDGEHSSGFDASRSAYRELKANVEDVDAIIVNDKRRIARDIDEVMRLVPHLREHDVELHTCLDGRLDLGDPVKAAIEIVQAAAAHEEKMQEIEKAKAITQQRQDSGYWHGGEPFGLSFGEHSEFGKRLVPDEPDFSTVMDVLDLRERGHSYRKIAGETGVSLGTCHRIVQRRELYEAVEQRVNSASE